MKKDEVTDPVTPLKRKLGDCFVSMDFCSAQLGEIAEIPMATFHRYAGINLPDSPPFGDELYELYCQKRLGPRPRVEKKIQQQTSSSFLESLFVTNPEGTPWKIVPKSPTPPSPQVPNSQVWGLLRGV